MGYHTDFWGSFTLNKPLKAHHRKFLVMFSDTRRMDRDVSKIEGMNNVNKECLKLLKKCNLGLEYYCGAGFAGQDEDDSIVDYNSSGMFPSLWCKWAPNEDGTAIQWNGAEKFYDYVEWLKFLVQHFLAPWGYVLNGEVKWEGESEGDLGVIVAKNNEIYTKRGVVVYR